MAKYDVFISCKSEDYPFAEQVYEFLQSNHVNAFLASRELRRLGESEYRKAISKAMQEAEHLIVFASNPEYIDSPWVYYEWDMFINAKLKGRKPGNIVTILKGVNTDQINMDLWKYESLTFDSYQATLLQYVETDQSRSRRQQVADQKQKEQQEAKRISEIKESLRKDADSYQKNKVDLSVNDAKIRAALRLLHIEEVKCPVCDSRCSIDDVFCKTCGWTLSPLEAVDDLKYIDSPSAEQLSLLKNNYDKTSSDYNSLESSTRDTKKLEDDVNKIVSSTSKKHNDAQTSENDKSEPINAQIPRILKWLFPDYKNRSQFKMVLLTSLLIFSLGFSMLCLWLMWMDGRYSLIFLPILGLINSCLIVILPRTSPLRVFVIGLIFILSDMIVGYKVTRISRMYEMVRVVWTIGGLSLLSICLLGWRSKPNLSDPLPYVKVPRILQIIYPDFKCRQQYIMAILTLILAISILFILIGSFVLWNNFSGVIELVPLVILACLISYTIFLFPRKGYAEGVISSIAVGLINCIFAYFILDYDEFYVLIAFSVMILGWIFFLEKKSKQAKKIKSGLNI